VIWRLNLETVLNKKDVFEYFVLIVTRMMKLLSVIIVEFVFMKVSDIWIVIQTQQKWYISSFFGMKLKQNFE
jgi:hypothetical protein